MGQWGLSLEATPTLTYDEFLLVCGGSLLLSTEYNPAAKYRNGVNNLLLLCYLNWASAFTQTMGRALSKCVAVNLGLGGVTSATDRAGNVNGESLGTTQSTLSVIKTYWLPRWVELDNIEDDLDTLGRSSHLPPSVSAPRGEKVLVPATASPALSSFLFVLNEIGTRSGVSIDTLQSLDTDAHIGNGKEERDVSCRFSSCFEMEEDATVHHRGGSEQLVTTSLGTRDSFSHVLRRVVYQLGMMEVARSYHALLSMVPKVSLSNARVNGKKSDVVEDIALQALFDLAVCQRLGNVMWGAMSGTSLFPTTTASVASGAAAASILQVSPNAWAASSLLAPWKHLLDPVSAELLLPLVNELSQQYVRQKQLLLPSLESPRPQSREEQSLPASSSWSSQVSGIGKPSSSAENCELLISRIFAATTATSASVAVPSGQNHSIVARESVGSSSGRFGLLPLALSAVSAGQSSTRTAALVGTAVATSAPGSGLPPSGASAKAVVNGGTSAATAKAATTKTAWW
jgi:hypothetical protein